MMTDEATGLMGNFNSQPPEGGWDGLRGTRHRPLISTHSRPKAAGRLPRPSPEMGWHFNSQPPEGGWVFKLQVMAFIKPISTHSRPKAAGRRVSGHENRTYYFNSQPPEGGWVVPPPCWPLGIISTHSRPKAAGIALCSYR